MAILSATELSQQAQLAYVRGDYYVILVDSDDELSAATTYEDLVSKEVPFGSGGYQRLSFNYTASDLAAYSEGQPLQQKIANFVHDNSSQNIVFTHVVVLRKVGTEFTVVAIESVGETAVLSSGKTASIRINLLHGRV